MRSFGVTLFLACSLATAVASADPATTPTTGATAAATTKAAYPKATVMIGSTTCFVVRECALGETPQQRADRINDVFNKYLGGSAASFAVKPLGKNSVITMNKEKLIVVTPLDVKTAKAKNVNQLTTKWKTLLVKAFNDTKAIK
jgi:hypothetical protein